MKIYGKKPCDELIQFQHIGGAILRGKFRKANGKFYYFEQKLQSKI